jgi:glycosyltransferase involved in cell wall biosynthesis
LSNFPFDHGEAIEVVGHEVLRIMAEAGHTLDVQVLLRSDRSKFNLQREQSARIAFSVYGNVSMLAPIYLRDLQPAGWWRKWLLRPAQGLMALLPGLRCLPSDYLFPARRALPVMRDVVWTRSPDIVLTIWSMEALAATHAIRGVPKFMYYGNPDHKPAAARLGHPKLFGIRTDSVLAWLKYRLLRHLNVARELQHIRMMRDCDVVANNSWVDAEYYRAKGHARSLYLQNMWPEPSGTSAPVVIGGGPVHIVGSVGNLGATGNTFGLFYIGKHIAPRLAAKMGGTNFVIDIFGGGQAAPLVANTLKHPSVHLRGWVDDLNSEIRKSAAFLVLTNVDGFTVGNTRILLAWSLGTCVVAHKDSALSMPEIRHGENTLLGGTPDEIVEWVYRAVTDPALRQQIGAGGRETYRRYYRSAVVVPKMLAEMANCVASTTPNEALRPVC